MTETIRNAAQQAEHQETASTRNQQLTPEQLQMLAKEVLRLMSKSLRDELDRRGQDNDRPGSGIRR